MFNWRLRFQRMDYIPFLLVATLFFIPISLSLKSILIVASTLAILFTPYYRQQLRFAFSQKWSVAAIIFFIVALLACFWGSADFHARFSFLEKYSKLLYLPILAIGFRTQKTRTLGIYAFLLAMTLTCILSIMKAKGDAGEIFHNHIITSYMVAFAAYIAGLFVIKTQGIKRGLFAILTLLFTYQIIFINTGRLGYVLYLVLMILLLLQTFPLKYIAITAVALITLSTLSLYQHSEMSSGFHRTLTEWQHYQQGDKDTSLGQRFEFQQFAKALFIATPWLGQGIAGYADAVQRAHFFPERKLADPHSQYWLVAAEFGLLGLAALFYFFGNLFFFAFRLQETKPLMLGLMISFLLANLSDSLLLYSAIGYLFIVFSALCFGEFLEKAFNPIETDESSSQGSPIIATS